MISTIGLALIGGFCGALVSVLGNLFTLPFVLNRQQQVYAKGQRVPLLGWSLERLQTITRWTYRYYMPVFFTVIGAMIAVQRFGDVS